MVGNDDQPFPRFIALSAFKVVDATYFPTHTLCALVGVHARVCVCARLYECVRIAVHDTESRELHNHVET